VIAVFAGRRIGKRNSSDFELSEDPKVLPRGAKRYIGGKAKPLRRAYSNAAMPKLIAYKVTGELVDPGFFGGMSPQGLGGGISQVFEGMFYRQLAGAFADRLASPLFSPAVAKQIALKGSGRRRTAYFTDLTRVEVIGCTAIPDPDANSVKTVASRVSDGRIIDGEKFWTSSGGISDFCISPTRPNRNGGPSRSVVEPGQGHGFGLGTRCNAPSQPCRLTRSSQKHGNCEVLE
jgi:alkylation response protein AidB-like acyl-CoA dehydrogenase